MLWQEAIFSASGLSEEEAKILGQAIPIYEDWVTLSKSVLWVKLWSLNQVVTIHGLYDLSYHS